MTEARALGVADHALRARTLVHSQRIARLARILFILGLVGLACAILIGWLKP